jgi:hypothetical protein
MQRLSRIKLLIIDEISAVPQRLIGCLSNLLCKVNKNTLVAGGIDIMLVGDWLQMPPTGGSTLFSKPSNKVESQMGHELWSSINYVVYLQEDMRHRMNPTWVEILKRIRKGQSNLSHLRIRFCHT